MKRVNWRYVVAFAIGVLLVSFFSSLARGAPLALAGFNFADPDPVLLQHANTIVTVGPTRSEYVCWGVVASVTPSALIGQGQCVPIHNLVQCRVEGYAPTKMGPSNGKAKCGKRLAANQRITHTVDIPDLVMVADRIGICFGAILSGEDGLDMRCINPLGQAMVCDFAITRTEGIARCKTDLGMENLVSPSYKTI